MKKQIITVLMIGIMSIIQAQNLVLVDSKEELNQVLTKNENVVALFAKESDARLEQLFRKISDHGIYDTAEIKFAQVSSAPGSDLQEYISTLGIADKLPAIVLFDDGQAIEDSAGNLIILGEPITEQTLRSFIDTNFEDELEEEIEVSEPAPSVPEERVVTTYTYEPISEPTTTTYYVSEPYDYDYSSYSPYYSYYPYSYYPFYGYWPYYGYGRGFRRGYGRGGGRGFRQGGVRRGGRGFRGGVGRGSIGRSGGVRRGGFSRGGGGGMRGGMGRGGAGRGMGGGMRGGGGGFRRTGGGGRR